MVTVLSIGERWKRDLASAAAERKAIAVSEDPEIIRTLRTSIYEAWRDEKDQARLYGWFGTDDVPGTDKDRVQRLAERLETEKRPLCPEDVQDQTLILVQWCAANGLECFLVPVKTSGSLRTHDICARPKQG